MNHRYSHGPTDYTRTYDETTVRGRRCNDIIMIELLHSRTCSSGVGVEDGRSAAAAVAESLAAVDEEHVRRTTRTAAE